MFVKYKDMKQRTEIDSYEIGDDFINIVFRNEPHYAYHYSYVKPGKEYVECLKSGAINRSGLTGYLNTHCRYIFEYKY